MEDSDDDDDSDDDSLEEEDEGAELDDDDTPLFVTHTRRGRSNTKATPQPKKPKVDPVEEVATSALARNRGRRGAAAKEEPPLQAVSVNFWSDPQGVAPAVSELAREFPFHAEGGDTPQTVVFSDGVCVTYTAAIAAKHATQEKKRSTAKHGHAAASSEDADLSMLNEHILNAFAQVRRENA